MMFKAFTAIVGIFGIFILDNILLVECGVEVIEHLELLLYVVVDTVLSSSKFVLKL